MYTNKTINIATIIIQKIIITILDSDECGVNDCTSRHSAVLMKSDSTDDKLMLKSIKFGLTVIAFNSDLEIIELIINPKGS